MKTIHKGFISPLLLALIAVLLVGGGAYVYTQLRPTASVSPKKETVSQITIDQIKNTDVPYPEGNAIVTLSNGEYFKSTGIGSGIYLTLSDQPYGVGYAYGDINGDGVSDLVAIFYHQDGGTGFFGNLYVFINKDGKPQYITREDIGDRNVMKSISIVNGVIILDILTQGPGDAAANPRLEEIIKFKLVGTKLIKS